MIHRLLQYRALAFALGGLALLALLYALTTRSSAPPEIASATADTPEPTGENVSPAVHARLMTLRAAVEDAPDDADAQLELARFLQDAHRYNEAAEAYEAALLLAPDGRQPWLDLANVYGANGAWEAAADAADRMAQVFPNDGAALYNAGAAFANDNQIELAQARFEAAALAPDSAMAVQARASLVRLATLEATPPEDRTAERASAPALSPTAATGPLPNGHPPIGSDDPGLATSAGRAPTSADDIRAAIADQPPLSARTNQ